MTEYAYHLMLAARAHVQGGEIDRRLRVRLQQLETKLPGMKEFYAAASDSVKYLREMKSGLPVDNTSCSRQDLIKWVGTGAPDWHLRPGRRTSPRRA